MCGSAAILLKKNTLSVIMRMYDPADIDLKNEVRSMRAATKTLIALLQNADILSYIFEEPFSDVERFDMGLRMLLLPPLPPPRIPLPPLL